MDERLGLIFSCIPYLIVSGYVCYALGAKTFTSSRWNVLVIFIGFIFHTAFLYERGLKIHHCPLTNLFETIAFLSWAIVLNYLLIGPVFRLSLLGAFTAPLVLVMNLFALLVPSMDQPRQIPFTGWWLEVHAALSVLAYGTLGLGAVAACMFLISNHYLKQRSFPPILAALPSVGSLDKVNQRVTLFGFILLTAGLAAGFCVFSVQLKDVKVVWSLGIWLAYAVMLLLRYASKLSPVKFASISIMGYSFVLLTFWGINFLSAQHQFGG